MNRSLADFIFDFKRDHIWVHGLQVMMFFLLDFSLYGNKIAS